MKAIYYRYGIKLRKLNRTEKITINCLQSFNYGELHEIMFPEETVGQTPADFSDEREFYIPIKDSKP